ncbi:hypothetical protein Bca4012_019588 [Brassica carinata]
MCPMKPLSHQACTGYKYSTWSSQKKFAEELSSVLEWMVNHCFSLQNVSSMREEIKKQFEMDESLSGSDISSLACKDQWMEDKHGNHKLPSKGQDGKWWCWKQIWKSLL